MRCRVFRVKSTRSPFKCSIYETKPAQSPEKCGLYVHIYTNIVQKEEKKKQSR